ncbi:MAG: DUF3127 domain-containing protein [Porphyromonadaceae bacterium]|nr:DUF3127 domain-containing protein [Porphyromonadaceae bacterium]
MNISGKVVQVLPIQTGTSKAGNPWQKQEFILEQGGQYPRKVCISLFGDNVAKTPQVGQDVMVSVDIDSREFNGRWYTEIKAWNIVQTGAQQAAPQQAANAPAAAPAQPQPAPAPQAGVADDLPF